MRAILQVTLALHLIGGLVRADDNSKPLVVEQKNSISPDKLYYVALEQEIAHDGADCSLQIRSRIDKKILATFDWQQFWDNLSNDCPVKWADDPAIRQKMDGKEKIRAAIVPSAGSQRRF